MDSFHFFKTRNNAKLMCSWYARSAAALGNCRTQLFCSVNQKNVGEPSLLDLLMALLTRFAAKERKHISREIFTLDLRFRQGCLVNPQKTPSSICTICNIGQETQGHILGSCKHPKMTGLILNRHGKATTLITTALRNSPTIGNCAIFVDAEGGERSARDTAHISWYPQAPTIPDADGNPKPTSLPDIILFPKIDSAAVPPRDSPSTDTTDTTSVPFTPTTQQKHIILIDVTFTDDLAVVDRFKQKQEHHNPYFTHLQALGWQPQLYPIVFTHSGCVTTSFRTL